MFTPGRVERPDWKVEQDLGNSAEVKKQNYPLITLVVFRDAVDILQDGHVINEDLVHFAYLVD